MKKIGTFQSARRGPVDVLQATYGAADGPMAIVLELANGEPLGKLSVNMYLPECSQDSRDLPPGCFYVKTYAENEVLAKEAIASGLFKLREDLRPAHSGFNAVAPVWELVAQPVPSTAKGEVRRDWDRPGIDPVRSRS